MVGPYMTAIGSIEQELQRAISIWFQCSPDYSKYPPVVALVFSDKTTGIAGYDLLLDNFKNCDLVLVLFKKENRLDISLVNRTNGDAINLKNLQFEPAQLKQFVETEAETRPFALAIGSLVKGELVLTSTRAPFSPLLVSQYQIK